MCFCAHTGRAPGHRSERPLPGHLQHEEEGGRGLSEGKLAQKHFFTLEKVFFSFQKLDSDNIFFVKEKHVGVVMWEGGQGTHCTVCTS